LDILLDHPEPLELLGGIITHLSGKAFLLPRLIIPLLILALFEDFRNLLNP
jgi:hypothetical protein